MPWWGTLIVVVVALAAAWYALVTFVVLIVGKRVAAKHNRFMDRLASDDVDRDLTRVRRMNNRRIR